MQGAEAILSKTTFNGRAAVVKSRMAKGYRLKDLDTRLRSERTKSEARLLHKAKLAGVDCPTVLCVDDFDITMTFVSGKRPEMTEKQPFLAGGILAKLHANDIIHGDYTPANLIQIGSKNKSERIGRDASGRNDACRCDFFGDGVLFVIDFGLGFVSNDIEDKAIDVFTMLRALDSKEKKDRFMNGYQAYAKAKSVLKRLQDVEKRVRYAV